MTIQRATVRVLTARLDKGGVKLPKSMTDAVDRLEPLDHHPGPERVDNDLVAAVATAYIDGRDPGTDKAVRALLERHALATSVADWSYRLETWAQARLGEIVAEHADEIMQACADAVTAAGEALAGAMPHLDRTRSLPDQAEAALRRGPAPGDAWRTATDAIGRIDALCDAQGLLAHEIGRHNHAAGARTPAPVPRRPVPGLRPRPRPARLRRHLAPRLRAPADHQRGRPRRRRRRTGTPGPRARPRRGRTSRSSTRRPVTHVPHPGLTDVAAGRGRSPQWLPLPAPSGIAGSPCPLQSIGPLRRPR